MPITPWYLRFLPHALVVLAVFGGLWFIYHKGEVAADNRHKLEIAEQRRLAAEADVKMQQRVAGVERKLQDVVSQVDASLGIKLGNLRQLQTTVIQPTLTREIRSEARFSDPNAGISVGMLNAINTARAQSNPACVTNADGSATCSLPAAQPVNR